MGAIREIRGDRRAAADRQRNPPTPSLLPDQLSPLLLAAAAAVRGTLANHRSDAPDRLQAEAKGLLEDTEPESESDGD